MTDKLKLFITFSIIFLSSAIPVQSQDDKELFYNLVITKNKEVLNVSIVNFSDLEIDKETGMFFYKIYVPDAIVNRFGQKVHAK